MMGPKGSSHAMRISCMHTAGSLSNAVDQLQKAPTLFLDAVKR